MHYNPVYYLPVIQSVETTSLPADFNSPAVEEIIIPIESSSITESLPVNTNSIQTASGEEVPAKKKSKSKTKAKTRGISLIISLPVFQGVFHLIRISNS